MKNYNNQAYVSAKEVVESFVQANNPLFLYEEEGAEKTLLLHAIWNAILEKEPDKKVLYVTGELFSYELVGGLHSARIDDRMHAFIRDFRNKYRNVDVLLIDDIQFIAGKESSQEEFFHTFNHLHIGKKQIVITSDKPPKEIEGLETRLQTRFEWGKSCGD